jgi:hypothetical protein
MPREVVITGSQVNHYGILKVVTHFWNPLTLSYDVTTGGAGGPLATVSVDNFPATQAVSGPLTDAQLRASPLAPAVYTTRLDEASATVTYVGIAAAGSAEASSVWQVKKITVTGSVTDIKFAGGSTAFNSAWSGRAGLSYS